MRRSLISALALAGFSVLAWGSGGGEETPDEPPRVDAIVEPAEVAEPPEEPATEAPPPGPGEIDVATWLDIDMKPCPTGTTRVGAIGPTDGTPFFVRPAMEPPAGLDVNSSMAADASHLSGFNEDDAARWCVRPDGTAHGPVVVSREAGLWRIHGTIDSGALEGTIEGWSYIDPEDGSKAKVRHLRELEGVYTAGDPSGKWKADCPLQDMAAQCPAGANVQGSFDADGKTGRWHWSFFDGATDDQSMVTYRQGQPGGDATRTKKMMDRTCASRGAVDERGMQGAWTERCTEGSKRAPTVVKNYKDGNQITSSYRVVPVLDAAHLGGALAAGMQRIVVPDLRTWQGETELLQARHVLVRRAGEVGEQDRRRGRQRSGRGVAWTESRASGNPDLHRRSFPRSGGAMVCLLALWLGVTATAAPGEHVEVDDGGPRARYTPGVPFSRTSASRELSCSASACLHRGGAGARPESWLRRGCDEVATTSSEEWLGFWRVCLWETSRASGGVEDVGIIERATGIATWRRRTIAEQDWPGPPSAKLLLAQGQHLLWVETQTRTPMQMPFATVYTVPGLEPLALHGTADKEPVQRAQHAAVSQLTTHHYVPRPDPRWKPRNGAEVIAFAESHGGCVGVYGFKPQGCQIRLEWRVDGTHNEVTGWRIQFCFDDTDDTNLRGSEPLLDGGFDRPGPDPHTWRWSGLPRGDSPCSSLNSDALRAMRQREQKRLQGARPSHR